MSTETNNIEITERDFTAYYRQLVPFGYMDAEAAIRTACEAGKDADWAAEQVTEYMESTDSKIDEVDPVACVYDSLLQIFRGEIEELTGFDFMNDSESSTPIYVAGNCMCTSFDYKDDAIQELTSKLKEHEISIEDMSSEAQWVLSELYITQETISAAA